MPRPARRYFRSGLVVLIMSAGISVAVATIQLGLSFLSPGLARPEAREPLLRFALTILVVSVLYGLAKGPREPHTEFRWRDAVSYWAFLATLGTLLALYGRACRTGWG